MVVLKFEEYIENKIKIELKSNRKKGNSRSVRLLVDILANLFWTRASTERCGEDIMRALDTNHKNLKMDTLSDNLEFLSSIGTPPFVIKSSEKKGITIYTDTLANTSREVVCLWTKKGGRPRNIYSLEDYYIRDYYSKEARTSYGLSASFE